MKSIFQHFFILSALLFSLSSPIYGSDFVPCSDQATQNEESLSSIGHLIVELTKSTGIYGFLNPQIKIEGGNHHSIGPETPVLDVLRNKTKGVSCETWQQRLDEGLVTDASGMRLNGQMAFSEVKGDITFKEGAFASNGLGRLLMILIGMLLLYLGIAKQFEPLLLIPISFGCILSNIPLAGISDEGGILFYVYEIGISTGVFPLIIFMGVGAMTDFGPLIANPRTILLGGAAQIGIFATLIGALALSEFVPGINFSFKDAASIGIIGGADGPTAIFLSSQLSPRLMGSIAVAAYSYMALVPLIQPPIMRALTTKAERKIRMEQLRPVGKLEKILFPIVVIVLCLLLLPSAAPLIGFFMFGNLAKECGVVDRLSDTIQNALINITTIFLGLGVGSKLSAAGFLNLETLGILILGIIAFSMGTAGGVLMAKFMNLFSKTKINPLIGSAGVSAVPMAARVSQTVGAEADPQNFLLMHAMGPNVAGVIGSAVAAGLLLAVFAK
jgi:oxaloacetate decarboxylase beta subunit